MTVAPVSDLHWSPGGAHPVGTAFEYSAATHVGMVRLVNEDAFLVGPPVFVVADGMGGHERGDVAAGIVIEEFARLVDRATVEVEDLDACIRRSRSRIESLATEETSPGSTVIAAAYVERSGHGYWAIAHEGDSRAYMWRDDELLRITKDHSIVQELIDDGAISEEEARVHPERHVITRALGGVGATSPDFSLVPVEPGARLLLCSDGLTGELSEASIATVLKGEPRSAEAATMLVRRAVQAGGHDNVTVVVVDAVTTEGTPINEDTLDSVSRVVEDTVPSDRRTQ